MARHAKPQYMKALTVQRLAQGPQAVGRISHAMQQEYATLWPLMGQFIAAIPVGRKPVWIRPTAATVALQALTRIIGNLVDYLRLQLRKDLILNCEILRQRFYFIRHFCGKFSIQNCAVPELCFTATRGELCGKENCQDGHWPEKIHNAPVHNAPVHNATSYNARFYNAIGRPPPTNAVFPWQWRKL